MTCLGLMNHLSSAPLKGLSESKIVYRHWLPQLALEKWGMPPVRIFSGAERVFLLTVASLIPHSLPRRPPANWQTPLKLNVPFPLIFVQFFSLLVFLLLLVIGFFQGNWPSTFLAIRLWLLQHWPRRLWEQSYKVWGETFMWRFKTASCPWKAIELYLIGNHWKPLSKALPIELCVFSCHCIYLSVFLTSANALHAASHLLLPVKTWILCSSVCLMICVKSSQTKAALQNCYFTPSPEEF